MIRARAGLPALERVAAGDRAGDGGGGPPGDPVDQLRPEPPVRGEAVLAAIDRGFAFADRWIGRVVPARWNPLAHTGAVATVALMVAVVSGIPLLFWYVPSVTQAHASLEQIGLAGGLLRSLHRYSSDVCMLFAALHALRLFAARRFAGARWLAWVTGIVAVALLWLTGWLGYWLVWDQHAARVAVESARFIDVLPVFADPFSRSFLTDASVKPLLFFIVFFLHMLVPLGLGIALWLHLARLARPRWLTARAMGFALLGALLVLGVIAPATSAAPARLGRPPAAGGPGIDAWYLWPLRFSNLSPGAMWALVLGGAGALLPVPLWLRRRRARAATVNSSRCNACERCVKDCPYLAIGMVADGERRVAKVDPAKCVGCGICVGSCNSGGTDVPLLPLDETRRRLDRLLDAASDSPAVAFVCSSSAGGRLRVDPQTGRCRDLPGFLVQPVPCSGWVHALLVERVLRHGARGVLVAGCAPESPAYREGAHWTALRLLGEREPALRKDRVEAGRARLLEVGAADTGALIEAARAFHDGLDRRRPAHPRAAAAAALLLGAGLSALVAAGSDTGCGGAPPAATELVVSFKDAGDPGRCRKVSDEENAKVPVHMRRRQICDRERAPVRMRVSVDGAVALERSYSPRGLFGDGKSVAVERLPVAPGTHEVTVELGESHDASVWTRREQHRFAFESGRRHVILFDRESGWTAN